MKIQRRPFTYGKLAAAGLMVANLMVVASCTSKSSSDSSTAESQSDPVHVNVAKDSISEMWVFNAPTEAQLAKLKSIPMVTVKGGTFMMGSVDDSDGADLDETPCHKVTLDTYKIAKYEMTQDIWTIVMGYNPSRFVGDSLPVEGVTWLDTQVFIEHLNELTGRHFRLPSEAEWEFAARGGNASRNYQYSGSDSLSQVAWFLGNAEHEAHRVGLLKPNELGIYDMSGNVYEWCNDWYNNYDEDDQVNPKGPRMGSHRVTRGGSWFAVWRRERCKYRGGGKPEYRSAYQGFRLAEDAN